VLAAEAESSADSDLHFNKTTLCTLLLTASSSLFISFFILLVVLAMSRMCCLCHAVLLHGLIIHRPGMTICLVLS
jgi:hypothetical protein